MTCGSCCTASSSCGGSACGCSGGLDDEAMVPDRSEFKQIIRAAIEKELSKYIDSSLLEVGTDEAAQLRRVALSKHRERAAAKAVVTRLRDDFHALVRSKTRERLRCCS